MIKSAFFDSYALIEIVRGNPLYIPYTSFLIVTTQLNIFEICYCFLRENQKDLAMESVRQFGQFAVEFDDELIKEAAIFKVNHKILRFSMTDSIGYSVSLKMGIPFLTGDKGFKCLPNVEFVPKRAA